MFRFADQQVDVLGHDDVSVNAPGEAATSAFQTLDEQVVGFGRIEERLPAITTEGEKVRLSGLMETMETAWHEAKIDDLAARGQ